MFFFFEEMNRLACGGTSLRMVLVLMVMTVVVMIGTIMKRRSWQGIEKHLDAENRGMVPVEPFFNSSFGTTCACGRKEEGHKKVVYISENRCWMMCAMKHRPVLDLSLIRKSYKSDIFFHFRHLISDDGKHHHRCKIFRDSDFVMSFFLTLLPKAHDNDCSTFFNFSVTFCNSCRERKSSVESGKGVYRSLPLAWRKDQESLDGTVFSLWWWW